MKKRKKLVLFRHKFYFHLIKPFVRLFFFFKFGYRVKNKYHIKRKQPVVVLCNHQADLDPFFVQFAFNTYLYTVASDHMFSSKSDQLQNYFFLSIPKKKGAVDVRCTMMMQRIIKQGGPLLMFPEGNRAYAEFQFPIDDSIAKLRHYNVPFVLFNLHGGTGINPRFGSKIRKGKFYGEVKKVITPDEYKDYSDEEFANIIRENLRVYDSDSGEKYKSKTRAEYLEREFFVCPKCGHKESLVSHGAYIKCQDCGLEVEYTEDLHLRSDDKDFKFNRMLDWYEYQKQWVRDYQVKDDEVIFSDKEVELTTRNPYHPVEFISKGEMKLTKDSLSVGDKVFAVKDIEVISPLKGNRLLFSANDCSYHIQGRDRFNPLKYTFMINKLDSKVKELGTDKMFSLD